MTPGPAPEPTSLKILKGNAGHRPLNKNEPQYGGTALPPAGLTDAGQQEWDRIVAILTPVGLATEAEQTILQMYATVYERWVEASDEVQRMGLIVKSPTNNYPMQNPYLAVVNKTLDQMKAYLAELGLTPAARTRVTATAAPDEENPWEALKRGSFRDRNRTPAS